jgi:ribosome biogenesis protein UTP30
MPLKQLNLEFRPFETKRALCTSYDLFLADECLHDILFNGSRLGKEFQKRRKMPIEIDMRNEDKLKDAVMEVLNSTVIRLTGKGAVV